MRKFSCWILLLTILSFVSYGGCGGSSDNGGSPGPADWSDLSGSWKPSSGNVTYFNSDGSSAAVFLLEASANSVEVTVAGAENLYDVTLGSGDVSFNLTSGSYRNTSTFKYNYINFGGTFSVSGNSLVRRSSEGRENVMEVIQYVDIRHVRLVLERKEQSTDSLISRATVNCEIVD